MSVEVQQLDNQIPEKINSLKIEKTPQKQKSDFSDEEELADPVAAIESLPKTETSEALKLKQIEAPSPIVDKSYSLEPDMIFGWKPSNYQFKGPISLTFENLPVNYIIRELWENRFSTKYCYQLLYIGVRYHNTLKLHQDLSSRANAYHFKYQHLYQLGNDNRILPFFQKFYQNHEVDFHPPFAGQNPQFINNQNILEFDSNFQSGNLDMAIEVAENQFDLFMRVDSNTRGHLLWYYFQLRNGQKGQTIKINICNFTKGNSLYERGMKPYVLSQIDSELHQQDWQQLGDNVEYSVKKLRYGFLEEMLDSQKEYCCLSFNYTFQHENDEIEFAYCVPYTFSYLVQKLQDLFKIHNDSQSSFAHEERLCTSLSGIDVPLITVTDFDDQTIQYQKRKVVLISGRIHPGQSNGSWVMHGLLDYLFSPEAAPIRKNTIFKIVPMLNPDGVILGNYRTGVAGRDLNREFNSGERVIFPTVFALKELVSELQKEYGNNLMMFLDLHGHSLQKNIFMYGPEYPIFDLNYYQCRVLPRLLADKEIMFRYYSSIFRISPSQKNTARAVIFNLYEIPNCFTIQTSNGSYYDSESQQTFVFTTAEWQKFGVSLGECISDFIEQLISVEKSLSERIQEQTEEKLKQDMMKHGQNRGEISNYRLQSIQDQSDDEGDASTRDQNSDTQIQKCQTLNFENSLKYLQDSQPINGQQNNNANTNNINLLGCGKIIDQNGVQRQNQRRDSQRKNDTELEENIMMDFEQSELGALFQNEIQAEQKRVEKSQNPQIINDDDRINQGGSDSESEAQDYDRAHLKNLTQDILQNAEEFSQIYLKISSNDPDFTSYNPGKYDMKGAGTSQSRRDFLINNLRDKNKANLKSTNAKNLPTSNMKGSLLLNGNAKYQRPSTSSVTQSRPQTLECDGKGKLEANSFKIPVVSGLNNTQIRPQTSENGTQKSVTPTKNDYTLNLKKQLILIKNPEIIQNSQHNIFYQTTNNFGSYMQSNLNINNGNLNNSNINNNISGSNNNSISNNNASNSLNNSINVNSNNGSKNSSQVPFRFGQGSYGHGSKFNAAIQRNKRIKGGVVATAAAGQNCSFINFQTTLNSDLQKDQLNNIKYVTSQNDSSLVRIIKKMNDLEQKYYLQNDKDIELNYYLNNKIVKKKLITRDQKSEKTEILYLDQQNAIPESNTISYRQRHPNTFHGVGGAQIDLIFDDNVAAPQKNNTNTKNNAFYTTNESNLSKPRIEKENLDHPNEISNKISYFYQSGHNIYDKQRLQPNDSQNNSLNLENSSNNNINNNNNSNTNNNRYSSIVSNGSNSNNQHANQNGSYTKQIIQSFNVAIDRENAKLITNSSGLFDAKYDDQFPNTFENSQQLVNSSQRDQKTKYKNVYTFYASDQTDRTSQGQHSQKSEIEDSSRSNYNYENSRDIHAFRKIQNLINRSVSPQFDNYNSNNEQKTNTSMQNAINSFNATSSSFSNQRKQITLKPSYPPQTKTDVQTPTYYESNSQSPYVHRDEVFKSQNNYPAAFYSMQKHFAQQQQVRMKIKKISQNFNQLGDRKY